MTDLTQYMTDKMSQSEFLSKLGWNAVKAFITSIILVAAFLKMMDLINNYTLLVISQVILTSAFMIIIYYHYFWTGKGYKGEFALVKKDAPPLILKDFFYTDRISSEENFMAIATSFICGLLTEVAVLVIIGTIKFSAEHSNSNETMSMLRVIVIGVIATAFYLYTQRNNLNKDFLGTIITCTIYGFGLSISAYLLGFIIGISNMVFGVPITIAILVLQFAFTSVYTYTDLIEWAKHTHKVEIADEERRLKKIEEDKQKAESIAGDKTEA